MGTLRSTNAVFLFRVLVGLTACAMIMMSSTSGLAAPRPVRHHHHHPDSDAIDLERRCMLHRVSGAFTFATFAFATSTSTPVQAATAATATATAADGIKSRTDGYAVQHTEREWSYILSGAQYNILRQGGTERQKASILTTFTSSANIGTYSCAGCNTPLFSSADKFPSNTGWPSFSASTERVELQDVNPLQAALEGREVRCRTCGGHLGDLFSDGWVYVGTSAAKTGQRYCIDGAALIYKPADDGPEVFGDEPPVNKAISYQPSMYRDPR